MTYFPISERPPHRRTRPKGCFSEGTGIATKAYFSPDQNRQMISVCQRANLSRSEFLRRAVMAFLASFEGVTPVSAALASFEGVTPVSAALASFEGVTPVSAAHYGAGTNHQTQEPSND